MSELIVDNNNDKYLNSTSTNNLNYFVNRLRLDFMENSTNKSKKMVINVKLANMGYDVTNGASVNVYKINKFIDDYEMKNKLKRQEEKKMEKTN